MTRIITEPLQHKKAKIKLPHLRDKPGAILSCRFQEENRGIIKNRKKCFKNAVSIDICTRDKNINMKISKDNIHISGASNEEQLQESSSYLFNYIIQIQKTLDILHMEQNKNALVIFKELIRGPSIKREETENDDVIEDKSLNHNSVIEWLNRQEENDITKIVRFLYEKSKDYNYYSALLLELEWIYNSSITKELYKGELKILNHIILMVNINYSLGFSINRAKLAILLNGQEGFIGSFNNSHEHSIKMKKEYSRTVEELKLIKKKKIPMHTFTIHRSGQVTQSGPGGSRMREAYILFRRLVNSNYDEILDHGDEF